ncbi:transcriptional regulator, LuxR family [Roseovarius azorensis]|uniref:Transcriptional regulator, LuxR family n=1 Tax=Roseovarius azorensis TaxID=1287727 RepID=A0A1H7N6A1_9RHOB|nr:helix-turn-helix transcriptional regulator [Roseovarius azorensis]SEL18528.1 transcriptional regulator, LuxR family [Roseovarius azorensis]
MTIATFVHKGGGQPTTIIQAADFLVRWAECLHGSGNLRDTLALFAELTGSRVVNLSRFDPETGRQRTITCFDLDAREGKRPLTKGMAPSILRGHGAYARPGTIWTLGEKDRVQRTELDNRSQRWMEDRGFGEVVVIPMGRDGTDIDAIEFYRAEPLEDTNDPILKWLASSAAEVWGRRRKGRIARLLRSVPAITERLQSPDPDEPVDILSSENPCRLTAAETRICILIQAGFALNEMGLKIGIAEATVRSHLRSIYAKTGAAGQIGLVRMLLDIDQQVHQAIKA